MADGHAVALFRCRERNANAAADVVSRVRALFKPCAERRRPLDLNEVVVEVMNDEIKAKNVNIAADLEGDLPPVLVDRVQMQQVPVNLIRNGLDGEAHDGRLWAAPNELGGTVLTLALPMVLSEPA